MHASQYRKIAEHPLRLALRGVIVDPRDLPTKSELRASIDEALPGVDAQVRDAVFTKALGYAKAAADDPGARFDLRGAADRLTLQVVEELEKAERILPADDVDEADTSSALEAIDNYDPTQARLRAVEAAARAAELEGNRARQMGGQS